MKITGWAELTRRPLDAPCALTCGVFDGVHRGHRALLEAVLCRKELRSAVVTFTGHPRRVLPAFAQNEIREITPLDEKIALFEQMGVDTLILVQFSPRFSRLEGAEFLRVLHRCAMMRFIAMGTDFKCGRNGAFAAADITALCAELGVEVQIVPPVLDDGMPVSSSRIRAALSRGDTVLAERLLGRAAHLGAPGHSSQSHVDR